MKFDFGDSQMDQGRGGDAGRKRGREGRKERKIIQSNNKRLWSTQRNEK